MRRGVRYLFVMVAITGLGVMGSRFPRGRRSPGTRTSPRNCLDFAGRLARWWELHTRSS